MNDYVTLLGKRAAAYKKPYLLRPGNKTKRTTSHSMTYKTNKTDTSEDEPQVALKSGTGNVQPPYRYGRKIQRSK